MKLKRILPLLLVVLFNSYAFGQETKKSDPSDIKKDFALLCELSKLSQRLSPSIFNDPADKVYRISKMVEAGISTPEAKNTYHALTMADAKDRERLWKQSAEDSGLKNWSCPGIGKNL